LALASPQELPQPSFHARLQETQLCLLDRRQLRVDGVDFLLYGSVLLDLLGLHALHQLPDLRLRARP